MAAGASLPLKDVMEELVSLCAGPGWITLLDDAEHRITMADENLTDALHENQIAFDKAGSSVADCNRLMYETVKRKLIADGRITDSMSETLKDWIIFTDDIITRSIHTTHFLYYVTGFDYFKWQNLITYVKMLEFPRFVGFNIRTNKRCLLAWMELFTVLLDTETKKKRDKSGKKNISYESSKFTDQCQNIIKLCDNWNQKDIFKKPEFQIDLTCKIFEQLIGCHSNHRGNKPALKKGGLERIWTVRLWNLADLQKQKRVDLSKDAIRYCELLTFPDPTVGVHIYTWPYCPIPVSEEEESYLVERRLQYGKIMLPKCEANLSNCKRASTKLKRGTKARAAREAATKEKCRKKARRNKRNMRALMQNTLRQVNQLTLANLAHLTFRSQPKRQKPLTGPISFKDWYNLDLLIQLVNVGAVLASDESPVKEMMEMDKSDALTALRQLRNKVRSDPDYFSI